MMSKAGLTLKTINAWLAYEGSLTAALVDRFGHIDVEKMQQKKALLPLVEAQKLGFSYRAMSLSRRVILSQGEKPLIYAQTYMPLESLVGKSRHLRFWDNRPLGHYLFTQQHVERSEITDNGKKRLSIKGKMVDVFQRESLFFLEGRPIIIYENFLPEFVAAINVKTN